MSHSTNPLGVHALVWAGGTTTAEVATAITSTKDAGYDLLEFSLHDSLNLGVAAARERPGRRLLPWAGPGR
jgi:D-psicose/D-tagatose/L-ribulose 3-epimerase